MLKSGNASDQEFVIEFIKRKFPCQPDSRDSLPENPEFHPAYYEEMFDAPEMAYVLIDIVKQWQTVEYSKVVDFLKKLEDFVNLNYFVYREELTLTKPKVT